MGTTTTRMFWGTRIPTTTCIVQDCEPIIGFGGRRDPLISLMRYIGCTNTPLTILKMTLPRRNTIGTIIN